MSDYLISARKYRPKSFKEVIGQEIITSTLENAVKNSNYHRLYCLLGQEASARLVVQEFLQK